VESYREALNLDGSFVQAHMDLGNALYLQGKDDEAIEEFILARGLSGASSEAIAAIRQAYRAGGRMGYWRHQLDVWERGRKEGRGGGAWTTARAYAEIGDRDRAFEWLEKAYDERTSLLVFLKTIPMFASLRDDARFADLVRRIGLP
jgi:tetratricopeptide (TPR) repeat protein